MLSPLASILFPEVVGDAGLDSAHSFVVHYGRLGGQHALEPDVDLPPHRDASDVTFNVALGCIYIIYRVNYWENTRNRNSQQ